MRMEPYGSQYGNGKRYRRGAYLEVIALPFTVHVRQKEDAKDDTDEVPLRKDEVECVINNLIGVEIPGVESTEAD